MLALGFQRNYTEDPKASKLKWALEYPPSPLHLMSHKPRTQSVVRPRNALVMDKGNNLAPKTDLITNMYIAGFKGEQICPGMDNHTEYF